MGVQWVFDIAGPFHINGSVVLLPFIQRDLDVSGAAVAWAVVIYFLATAVFVLLGAYLGNALGRKKLVLVGVAIDVCSQFGIFLGAPFWGIILLRLIGGIGNAMIVPNLSPMTVSVFPIERRGQALGLIMVGLGIGIVFSTVVAGVLADTVGWRYLFLLTGSMYALLFLGVLVFSKESESTGSMGPALKGLDYRGLGLIAGFLVALTLGMQRLGQSISDPLGLSLVLTAVPLAAAFVYVERRAAAPLVPLGLFAKPAFASAVGHLFAMAMARSAHAFLLPFYLIQGLGWSGSYAGTVLIALSAGQLVLAPISGTLADRTGPRIFIITGQLVMIAGTGALISLGSDPAPLAVILSLSLVGSALGLFRPPNMKILFDAVPPENMSLAPGVQVLTGHASNALGASFVAMLLTVFLSGDVAAAYRNSLLVVLVGFVLVTGAIWGLTQRSGAR